MAEHYRPAVGSKPEGLYQGYYCSRCGTPCSLIPTGDCGLGICVPDPNLVKELLGLNTPEAFAKREFIVKMRSYDAPAD